MNEVGAATNLGCGVLSSCSEGESSEEAACWPRSVPSADTGRCSSDCKHGSGDGMADTCVYRKNPVGTLRSDVKGRTGNEFSRWSIEVVHRHSGPVFAKILKIVRGEREPTQARARVGGRQPTQADTHGGGFAKK